jgi:acyl-CoA synthetase (AMP-forming)/AMP-acid ligase II
MRESCKYKVGLFGDIMLRNALFYPQNEAFVYGDQRMSFERYNKRVNSIIHALLHKGVRKGDVLGVLAWNCLEYMEVFGAAQKGGFIIAPLNARSSIDELKYLINDSQATTLFLGPEFAEIVSTLKLEIPSVKHFISFEKTLSSMEYHHDLLTAYPSSEPDVIVDDKDRLFICYTSGTTGRPKGALYTHQRFREDILCHVIEVPIDSDDRGISLMPLFHIGGIAISSYFFYQGATTVIMKFFDPSELLNVIQEEKITNMAVVPTHLAMILDVPDFEQYDIGSIRRIYYAGSPMPKELLMRGMSSFGSVFFQAYGQTESGPEIAFLKEKDHDVLSGSAKEQKRLSSSGRPARGVHVRIEDDKGKNLQIGEIGEIVVQSRHLMNEYWNRPDETKQTIVNGWLHTGDMGWIDEDGYLYIVDRKQDMIVSGGENIYPREVEEVLYKHPTVLECAVFGVPHSKWVEAVYAIVSFKRNMRTTPEELIKFCKNNLSGYKVPKSIEIINEILKSETGKILKKEIKKKYWNIT